MLKQSIFLLLTLLLVPLVSLAQEASAKRDLINVRSARTIGDESFNKMLIGTRGRIYSKTDVGFVEKYAITNATGFLTFQYGWRENWQIDFSPVFYQDVNFTTQPNQSQGVYISPEDMLMSLRYGSERASSFDYGAIMEFRINTGQNYDVYLEPYESENHSAILTGTMSYSFGYTNKDNFQSIFLNLSYLNHFDGISSLDPGIAFYHPVNQTIDYWVELYGSFFLQQPDSTYHSRENYMYIAPGMRYKLFSWVFFELGVDVLISSSDDQTAKFDADFKSMNYPGAYPPWRFNISLITFPFSDYWLSTSVIETEILPDNPFSPDIDEGDDDEPLKIEGVDAIERQLKRLREEQKKALEELEELKEESDSF